MTTEDKTQPQGRTMLEIRELVAAEDRRRDRLLRAFGELTDAKQIELVDFATNLARTQP